MTIDQLDQFLLCRANKNIKDKQTFHDAKLILINHASGVLFGMQFASPGYPVFFIRYWKNNVRQLFKIDIQTPEFKYWRSNLNWNSIVDYNDAPKNIKSYVVSMIKQALTTPGIGIDMYTYSILDDTLLIKENESYEEAAIEMDLAGLGAFE